MRKEKAKTKQSHMSAAGLRVPTDHSLLTCSNTRIFGLFNGVRVALHMYVCAVS